jgi:hypothetical protein
VLDEVHVQFACITVPAAHCINLREGLGVPRQLHALFLLHRQYGRGVTRIAEHQTDVIVEPRRVERRLPESVRRSELAELFAP